MAGDRYLDPEWDDGDLPAGPELASLALEAERAASALPVSAVRRLGSRRRRRRHAAIGAGALALVVLAGGVAVGNTGTLFTQEPPVVATPTPIAPLPAPTPTGPIEDVNELQVDDIPHRSTESVEKIEADAARPVTSACVGDGLEGAVESWGFETGFRVRPTDAEITPDPDAPLVGTLILAQLRGTQSAADGTSLYDAVRQQIKTCPDFIATNTDDTVLGPSTVTWVDVDPGVSDSRGGYGSVAYRKKGEKGDDAWFESIGVTQYRERLMVTVRIVHAPEDSWSDKAGGAPADGMAENPQFALNRACARRLTE